MTTANNVDLNYSKCIQAVSNFGETVYHNICNGSIQVVPWGSADWLSNIGLGILMGALILLIIGVVVGFFGLAFAAATGRI